MPTELLLGLLIGIPVGIVGGGAVAWGVATSRGKRTRDLADDLRGDLADAEARLEETRDQRDQWKAECGKLRAEAKKVDGEWTAARTRLSEAERHLKEQKALVEQAKAQLSDTFKALAAQALSATNREFLVLAREQFQAHRTESASDLDARRVAIEALVKPIGDSLATYQKVTGDLEEKRQKDMGALGEQLRAVASTQTLLHAETHRLVSALKSPQVRGRWGEVTLRRTAELAGMTPHCDFVEQPSVRTEDGPLRPDMIVRLPAEREVVVDSKVSLDAFIRSLECDTEEERSECLDRHAEQVASHIDRLAAKEYWGQFPTSPEFVVLFIPNDSFLAAAAERDPGLVESALGKKVVLATPSTFVALLRAIEYGWRQQIAVENAQRIRHLGQELSDRVSVLVEHLARMGAALGKAVESYNAAVGSFESRVLPAARRFRELGAGGRKVIEELAVVDARPRDPTARDGE